MHYYALVEIPEGTTIEQAEGAVEPLLEPHEETDYGPGWWDWYVIGGRWTGRLDGYDPTIDPANLETCWLCHGTGTRPDGMNGPGGCNGCQGNGKSVSWRLALHAGDIAQRGSISMEDQPYTLVTSARVTHKEIWQGGTFVKTQQEHDEHWASIPVDTWLVVVDYHD